MRYTIANNRAGWTPQAKHVVSYHGLLLFNSSFVTILTTTVFPIINVKKFSKAIENFK